ncbi:MAG: hypothetical protein E7218_03505 [Anaerofustis stercorihominis]|nr:hypothetical protein [Anaerofustis stercorihominis]
MKRKISLLLITLMILSLLCACGKDEPAVLRPFEVPEEDFFKGAYLGMSEEEFALLYTGAVKENDDIYGTHQYFLENINDNNFYNGIFYGFYDGKLAKMSCGHRIKMLDGQFTDEEINENFRSSAEAFLETFKEIYSLGDDYEGSVFENVPDWDITWVCDGYEADFRAFRDHTQFGVWSFDMYSEEYLDMMPEEWHDIRGR